MPTEPFHVDGSARVFANVTTRATHTAAVVTSAAAGALLFVGFLLVPTDLSTPSWPNDKSALDWATGTVLFVGTVSFLVGMTLLATSGKSQANVTPR